MKNLKKIMSLILILLFVITLMPTNINEVQAAKTKLNKTSISIQKGNTYPLKLQNNTKTIKWTSSNKKIATVNSDGLVTARKVGTCKVYAKVGKKKYTCSVIVKEKDTVTFSCDELILTKGNSFRQLMINKNVYFFSGIKWSSSNKKVATVDSSGRIKAKNAGDVTITAKYKNKKYNFKLKVVDNIIIYEDDYVKVALEYLYSLASNEYDSYLGNDSIHLTILNKTDKAFTFVTTNLAVNGKEVASNRLETTKVTANSESYNYGMIFDKPVVISSIKTLSGSMYIFDGDYNTISTIDFSNINIK